jgi:CO/xanthine dehydrogenase FAD-binding subunit
VFLEGLASYYHITVGGATCRHAAWYYSRPSPLARRIKNRVVLLPSAAEEYGTEAELLKAIRIPRPSRAARCGYYKVCRKAGEFALANGAVLVDSDRDCFRAVIGATQGRPIVIDDAQGPEAHMLRIAVIAEREGVAAVEPAHVGMAARMAVANDDHDECSRG